MNGIIARQFLKEYAEILQRKHYTDKQQMSWRIEYVCQVVQALYKHATGAVLGIQIGGIFRTTLSVRQRCVL